MGWGVFASLPRGAAAVGAVRDGPRSLCSPLGGAMRGSAAALSRGDAGSPDGPPPTSPAPQGYTAPSWDKRDSPDAGWPEGGLGVASGRCPRPRAAGAGLVRAAPPPQGVSVFWLYLC